MFSINLLFFTLTQYMSLSYPILNKKHKNVFRGLCGPKLTITALVLFLITHHKGGTLNKVLNYKLLPGCDVIQLTVCTAKYCTRPEYCPFVQARDVL